MPAASTRPRLALAAAALAAAALVLAPVAPAAADEGRGWARLAHLSPDTSAVDIRVTDASGAQVLRLDDVGYGIVSPYAALPAGRYRATLVPAGAPATAEPVLGADLEIRPDVAVSALVHGRNAGIRATVLVDDLSRPADGRARIRVAQMSAGTPSVDVATSTGMPVASALRRGAATGYLEVPAGPWTLDLTGNGRDARVDVDAEEATSTTLFVVDTADGGLAMLPVLDSAATGDTPIGGLATGGGWLAQQGAADAASAPVRARGVPVAV